jgi:hypothetical protein
MRVSAGLGVGLVVLAMGLGVAACGSSTPEADKDDSTPIAPITDPTVPAVTVPTTVAPTTAPGVPVPNVIGMKPPAARLALFDKGFSLLYFNKPCNKGTVVSQSVVASLSVPARGRDPRIGATPLSPGTPRPARSVVAVTWSDCYPSGAVVPTVTGLTFANAVHTLHLAGLKWACFSSPPSASTATTADPGSSTTAAVAADTASHGQLVLSQGAAPGTVLKAHTVIDISMRHCPQ